MLTVHAADLLLTGPGAEPVAAGAVVVDGARIAAVGPYEELAADHPGARERRWPGLLTPGLCHAQAPALLETAYHPDPREAAELGTEPVAEPAALAGLALTDARWGESARRGTQRMLRHGTTAVTGPFARPAVRTAVARAGLVVLAAGRVGPTGAAPSAADAAGDAAVPRVSLDPLAALPAGAPPDAAFTGPLAPGARADFAVFAVPTLADLAVHGAASCVATVLDGRLVFRRR
ncbi:imidazolonepropionase-like domain-containing protein [Streptomyces sp. 796.1]|uniref:amidohydrolase family protein n=1 Tax=Streptomyces sp. 796.1 TaxID=3163029 RepID=UPI0039C98853